MGDRAQALLREALMLPTDERADVAAELIAGLDDTAPEDPMAVQDARAIEYLPNCLRRQQHENCILIAARSSRG